MFSLPTNDKFELWFDEDGDFVLQSAAHPGLISHGKTPNEAVETMSSLLDMWVRGGN